MCLYSQEAALRRIDEYSTPQLRYGTPQQKEYTVKNTIHAIHPAMCLYSQEAALRRIDEFSTPQLVPQQKNTQQKTPYMLYILQCAYTHRKQPCVV